MQPTPFSFLAAAAAIFVAVTLVWLLSIRLRDVSIVDIFWGLGFVICVWIYRALGPDATPRQLLVAALVTLWGVRLAAYIGWRHDGEDYRYRAMRERVGDGFIAWSYGRVFLLQGLLVLLISTPLLLLQTREAFGGWRWSDGLGLGLFVIGFFFEAVGDWQMARFKADPNNRGKVLDRGLWALTRHPNYFGDAAIWWGFYAFALAVPGGIYTLPSVLLMTLLLLKVSGVALLEKTIVERRPAYRDYIERTSAFIPWFPGRKKEAKA